MQHLIQWEYCNLGHFSTMVNRVYESSDTGSRDPVTYQVSSDNYFLHCVSFQIEPSRETDVVGQNCSLPH